MKYIVLLFWISIFCAACSEDDNNSVMPSVSPESEGTWTDPRDGVVYHWVRYGGLDWLCENMRGQNSAGSAVTAEEVVVGTEDFLKYGYLYDFTAANSLGIDGWRLPSDEDWKKLEMALGMSAEEADETGWRGQYVGTLLMQDAAGSGLGLLCGGYAHNLGGFGTRRFQVDGIYWCSTPDASQEGYAWCRMITFNKEQVRRETMTTKRYMSVRLVRDAQ